MPPQPSIQGDIGTCTRHALGKCVVAAAESICSVHLHVPCTCAPRQNRLDFRQDPAISAFMHIKQKDNKGAWPEVYHGEEIILLDYKTHKNYYVKMTIIRCPIANYQANNGQHVLVYRTGRVGQHQLHTVYVKRKENAEFICLNSWGMTDPEPRVNINQNENILYNVNIAVRPAAGKVYRRLRYV